jgi:purine-cytosine permease-like protein
MSTVSDPLVSDRTGSATEVETDKSFQIESHGIDYIPLEERHGSAKDLFWVWLAANLIFTYIFQGIAVFGFGLSLWAAVSAILVGYAFYLLVGLGGISGPVAGTATLVASRSAFGPFGNIPAGILSWLTVVGWEAVNLVLGTFALVQFLNVCGIHGGDWLTAVCLGATAVVTFAVAVWGHATIVRLQRYLSVLLGIGIIILAAYVIPKFNTGYHAQHVPGVSPVGAWLLGVLVCAAGPLGWVNYPADYSRYLSPATAKRKIVLWSTLGGILPSIIITFVGLAASTVTDMSDPVAGLKHILPAWFFTPYLLIIVFGGIANNFLNTYSSGLSLLSVGIRIKRWRAVMIDAVLATALSVYALFIATDFIDTFIAFLSLTVIWLAPWCAVYLVDMAMRRNRYDPQGLQRTDGGPYWYDRGVNWAGIAAFAVGVAGAAMFANSTKYRGPLIHLVGHGDISEVAGLVLAGIVYFALMRRRITAQRHPPAAETST